tara:strand:+ start:137 stop:280 length:144 start_codon:yes stop_codon:yes gene_type:complete
MPLLKLNAKLIFLPKVEYPAILGGLITCDVTGTRCDTIAFTADNQVS